MARIRSIKPEFWTDSKTGTLSGVATKLFLGILNHCDDYGVIAFNPLELKAKILPYESGSLDVAIMKPVMEELIAKELLLMFQYSQSGKRVLDDDSMNVRIGLKTYLYVQNFLKHQRVDRPGDPLIAEWGKGETYSQFVARCFPDQTVEGKWFDEFSSKDSTNLTGTLAEDSTSNHGTLALDRKGKEGRGKDNDAPLASDSGSSPEGLEPAHYARGILEQLDVPYTATLLSVVSQCVVILAKQDLISTAKAADLIIARGKLEIQRGEKVNRFWFEDKKFIQGETIPRMLTIAEQVEKTDPEYAAYLRGETKFKAAGGSQ